MHRLRWLGLGRARSQSWAAHHVAVLVAAALLPLLAGACDDLQSYEGTWRGSVAGDPQLRQGFAPEEALSLVVEALDGSDAQLLVQLPRAPQPLRFEPIRRASADALGSMTLSGDSLRSYFGFVRAAEGEPYLVVVTLFAQKRIEVRVIRGAEETYGVFRLSKE